jgi:hypothetical protein
MRQKKPYKRYSPEFKREALKRATEEGVTDKAICKVKILGSGLTFDIVIRAVQLRLHVMSCMKVKNVRPDPVTLIIKEEGNFLLFNKVVNFYLTLHHHLYPILRQSPN